MNQTKFAAIGVFVLLVGLGVASRLIKEICPLVPPNFHAIVGTALFAGFFLKSTRMAAAVPLTAMGLSDLVIGSYEPLLMLTVYASLVAPIAWRGWLLRRMNPTRLAGASIASSLLFFFTTDLAVWYHWYPHTAAGIARCYAAALPFLGYALCGDLLFAGGLFAVYWLATRAWAPQDAAVAAGAAV